MSKDLGRSLVGLFVLLGLLLTGSRSLFSGPDPSYRYDTVFSISNNDDAVHLPMVWHRDAPGVYRRTLYIDAPVAQDSTLYIPYFARTLSIELNGEPVYVDRPMVHWAGRMSFGSVLLDLPNRMHHGGLNRLTMTVVSESPTPVVLSPIYIGPRGAFDGLFQVRRFLAVDLNRMAFGAQLLLGLVCLAIVLVRRSEKPVAWLVLVLVGSSGTFVGTLSTTFPSLEGLWPIMFLLAISSALAAVGFAYSFIGRAPPRLLLPTALVLPPVLIGLVVLGLVPVRWLGLYVAIPVHLVSIAWFVVILLRDNPSEYGKASRFMGYAGALLLFTMLHDFAVAMGLVESGFFVAQSFRIPLFIAIGTYLTVRLVKSLEAGDRAAHVLREKLADREAQLTEVLYAEKELAQELATQHERDRIRNDLHDGVAGHLSTIIALSEHDVRDRDEIKRVARFALTDLLIIINALDTGKGNLLSVLAVLRERSLNPLRNLGIEVQWSMLELPDDFVMETEKVISVARIVQESVTNAVKHGKARKISVSGTATESGGIELSVENSGGLALPRGTLTLNNGIRNMRLRARELGADFTIVPTLSGACVTLTIPMNGGSSEPSTEL